MEGGNDGSNIFNIHLNSALTHLKLGKESEHKEMFEKGYKHYMEASNKLMDLLKLE